jgi:tetratricopeptide (TPR) repeat protein
MKRFIGFILDILFFSSFLGVLAIGALYIIYRQENDIAIINTYLQSQLTWSMYALYGFLLGAYVLYYLVIPRFLKQTVGQRLAGTVFLTERKLGLWAIFLKNIIGVFWDVLLFPYTIIVAIRRKPLISTRLSRIEVVPAEKKMSFGATVIVLLFAFFFVATAGIGTYVYRQGVTTMIERYTDYEKQMKQLIEMYAYQDAQPILEKYKQYHGEDNNYSFYLCLIEANLATDLSNLELCNKALESNKENTGRVKTILAEQAKLYAANDQYTEAEKIYSRLWNEFSDRSMNMKNYVAVLSELKKSKEATAALNEIAAQVLTTDAVELRDLGNLYERIGQIDLALEKYAAALAAVPETENPSLAGELYYSIGVLQYQKGKYTDATASFGKAKTLNKDYADSADSYIILISKLKNSVTK